MPIPATVGAFAIVPCNDLLGAVPFWERLGFARTVGDANYIILTGWECEVHLTQAGTGPWSVPTEHNPFGVFIRTPEVKSIAARVDDLIIRPGGILRHREWGCTKWGSAAQTVFSFALAGRLDSCSNQAPDGLMGPCRSIDAFPVRRGSHRSRLTASRRPIS
jgi:hypothetical protein